jgi:hypothetical protein
MSTTTSELLPPSSSLRVLLVSAGVLPTGEDIPLDASLSVHTVEDRSCTPPAPPKPRLRQDAPIFEPAKSRAPPAPAAPVRAGMDLNDGDASRSPRYVCTDRNTLVVAGLPRAAGCAGLVNLLVRPPHYPSTGSRRSRAPQSSLALPQPVHSAVRDGGARAEFACAADAARAYAGLSKHAASDGRLLVAYEKVYAGGVHTAPPCTILGRAAMGPRMHGALPPSQPQTRRQQPWSTASLPLASVGRAGEAPRMQGPRPPFQLQSHVPQLRSVSAPCAIRSPAPNSATVPNPAVACSRAQPRPASTAPGPTMAPPFPELAAHLDPCALVVTATEPCSTASVVRAESLVSDLCVRSSPLSIDAARTLIQPHAVHPRAPATAHRARQRGQGDVA